MEGDTPLLYPRLEAVIVTLVRAWPVNSNPTNVILCSIIPTIQARDTRIQQVGARETPIVGARAFNGLSRRWRFGT